MVRQLSPRMRALWISVPSFVVLLCLVMMFFLNHEPPPFNPIASATLHAQEHHNKVVTGYTTTATLIETVDVLLTKRGGYMSNDILPPWVFLDNLPNWEFGVLTQVRDLARAMRNDFSRSQTQSMEDPDLAVANENSDVSVLLNQGDGTFIDITSAAGVGVDGWSASAAFCDFDRDGYLDLYVTRYVDFQPAKEHAKNQDPFPQKRDSQIVLHGANESQSRADVKDAGCHRRDPAANGAPRGAGDAAEEPGAGRRGGAELRRQRQDRAGGDF